MSARPQVGDRVRVEFTGVIVQDDGLKDDRPYFIEQDNSGGWRAWHHGGQVTVITPEWHGSERSDTALERRLVALEQDLKHWSDNSQKRLAELERMILATSDALSHLEAKHTAQIPELQRRTQNVTAAAQLNGRVSKLEFIVSRLSQVFSGKRDEEDDETPY